MLQNWQAKTLAFNSKEMAKDIIYMTESARIWAAHYNMSICNVLDCLQMMVHGVRKQLQAAACRYIYMVLQAAMSPP